MKINKIRPLEHDFTKVLETLVLNIKMLYYYGKLPENVVFGDNASGFGESGGGDFGSGWRSDAGSGRCSGVGSGRCSSVGNGWRSIVGNGRCSSIEGGLGMEASRPKVVAIVGSRKNTSYGYEVAYNAAFAAAKAGAIVVSGLAYGVDSIAHRGALDAGGVTLAVLGTPIDEVYPRKHTGLAQEIVEKGGAIISEYGPGERAESGKEAGVRFLQRNRIIAGLADVVLVAEAADRSGSLNTATNALNYSIELMAAPGDINRESSRGCNKLLTQGAHPYTEPNDLLSLLFPERQVGMVRARKKAAHTKSVQTGVKLKRMESADEDDAMKRRLAKLANMLETEVERKIMALILTGVQDGEQIMKKLELPTPEFNQTITILEIKGVVKPLAMNRWMVRG